MHSPTSGPQGDFRDSCIVCLRPTDTGLMYKGPAEWAIAGLMHLGVPQDQATATVSVGTDNPPEMVPGGTIRIACRVCERCARRAEPPMQMSLLAGDLPIPTYAPMEV